VAIDARVQRRPPRALVKEEDAAVEQAAELVLNDSQVPADKIVRSLEASAHSQCVPLIPHVRAGNVCLRHSNLHCIPDYSAILAAQVAAEVLEEVVAGSASACEALRHPDAVARFQQVQPLACCCSIPASAGFPRAARL
jgi:hypothetical protein